MPTLTKKQLEQRRHAMMASDIPALLGIDDFTTPLMLAYKKLDTSPVVINEPNLNMDIGHYVEPITNKLFKNETGKKTKMNKDSFFKRHHGATPDAFVINEHGEETDLVEFKYSTKGSKWASLPDFVFCQVQWQLHVMNRERCDVAALIAWRGTSFKTFEVYRDENFIENVVKLVDEFWSAIKSGHVPVATGTKREEEAINSRFKNQRKSFAPLELDDVNFLNALEESEEIGKQDKQVQQRKRQNKNLLKAYVGENPDVRCGPYKVTWKAPKQKYVVNFQQAMDDAMESLAPYFSGGERSDILNQAFQQAIDANTEQVSAARRFNIYKMGDD